MIAVLFVPITYETMSEVEKTKNETVGFSKSLSVDYDYLYPIQDYDVGALPTDPRTAPGVDSFFIGVQNNSNHGGTFEVTVKYWSTVRGSVGGSTGSNGSSGIEVGLQKLSEISKSKYIGPGEQAEFDFSVAETENFVSWFDFEVTPPDKTVEDSKEVSIEDTKTVDMEYTTIEKVEKDGFMIDILLGKGKLSGLRF